MVSRALWKGQLRLSLISVPVEVFSAMKSGARFAFRQIHEPSGKPAPYDKVVEGIGPWHRLARAKACRQDRFHRIYR